jgi:hypothetical protein
MNAFRALATRSIIVGVGLVALVAAGRPLQARPAEPLLEPTPLVLKDGRIASVSIHTVPFAPGRADLSGDAAARVAELTRAAGTDCFLTAQVIGHIDSNEVSQDDTLNAHRLARSRAEAVQASLIGGGLPAKAIASVWDWQFMVRAPRATLWIFQLTAGEDCEGRPLDGALVAQATPSNARPAGQLERAATPAPGRAATTAGSAADAQGGATARPAEPVAAARAQAEPAARAAAPDPAPAPPAAATERVAAARPAERQESGAAVAARPALAPKAQADDGNAPALVANAPAPVANARASAANASVPTTSAPAVVANAPATTSAPAVAANAPALAANAPASAANAPAAAANAPALAANAPASAANAPAAAADAPAPAANASALAAIAPPPVAKVGQAAKQRETGTAKPAAAARSPAGDGKVESDAGNLVITFATNSSYFPSGTAKRLRALVAGLASGRSYEVNLQVAVSGTTKVVGARSPEEAAAYNKWLAERRLERVQSWLVENAAATLSFKPEYVTDESRRVVVQLAPTG